MNKSNYYPSAPPPAAPPSYNQAVGGVLPASPFTPVGVVNGPRIITTVIPVGPSSTHMQCPQCQREIMTATRKEPSTLAYLSGFVIALLGCWCGCCFIPCFLDSCLNVHHTCPNCNAYLGNFRR